VISLWCGVVLNALFEVVTVLERRWAVHSWSRRGRWWSAAAVAGLLGLTVAACGENVSSSSSGAATEAGTEPVAVQSCGRSITSSSAPQRIVAGNGASASTFFALGVGDRLVGVGGTSSPAPSEFAEKLAMVPPLGDNSTGPKELVLSKQPDLVFGSGEYYFDATSGQASVEELTRSGIAAYISNQGCPDPDGSLSNLYVDIENLGKLLRIPDKANALISDLRERVTRAKDSLEGKVFTVAILAPGVSLSAGTYAIGPKYTEGAMLTALGQTNVYSDLTQNYVKIGLEDVTQRNPDVIFLDQDDPKALDEARDQFQNTPAAKNGRIFLLPYSIYGGPGSVMQIDRLEQIAQMLAGNQ
jgi:iron complex transport system substrate-binding protein